MRIRELWTTKSYSKCRAKEHTVIRQTWGWLLAPGRMGVRTWIAAACLAGEAFLLFSSSLVSVAASVILAIEPAWFAFEFISDRRGVRSEWVARETHVVRAETAAAANSTSAWDAGLTRRVLRSNVYSGFIGAGNRVYVWGLALTFGIGSVAFAVEHLVRVI